MRSRSVLWLVPILLAIHNAEEALFFPRYLPFVLYRLPAGWQALIAPLTTGQVGAALAVVTAVAFLFAGWAYQRPESRLALWLVLLIQATVLLNVLWHLAAAVVLFGGYAPGVVTALLINLPFSLYLLGRARQEHWLSSRALWALVPAAVVLHGPLLAALMVLTERWSR
ncbi:MAG TPA: HXXEE domain-containing protein [Gemmatimonadales bacterium]|nr:HXXEE domain-containing protein [Gemmatimonadales bacterium]